MKRISIVLAGLMTAGLLLGCKGKEGQVKAEQVDTYKPNLPAVPTIPKPTVPETYGDGSFSVYGLRKQITQTIDTQVTVTAYIAKIYQKPVCDENVACPALMPHFFLADDKNETLTRRYLRVVGYANSFQAMDDQKERDEKGLEDEPMADGTILPPIIWDWQEGRKYKITGRFTRQTSEGFMATDGNLEYSSRECLDCPVEEDGKTGKTGK
jgi:hypothetical protein